MGMPRILAIRKPAVRVGIGQCFPEAAVCELRIPPPTSSSTLARIFITANLGASWSASLPTQRVLESTGVRLLDSRTRCVGRDALQTQRVLESTGVRLLDSRT